MPRVDLPSSFKRHWPPCPRCGSYRTEKVTLGRSEYFCPDCGKTHKFRGERAPKLLQYKWSHHRVDEYKNEYAIQRDQFYGRRWLLWINLRSTGFWFMYGGAYWLLSGAKRSAQFFEDHCAAIVGMPEFQAKYHVPAEVVDGTWVMTAHGYWVPRNEAT